MDQSPVNAVEDGEEDELVRRIAELERASMPLEPDAGERERLRSAAIASTERFLTQIDTLKTFEVVENPARGLLDAPIGERGIGVDAALELLEREVVRPGANPASGGHLAYIPGGGLYHSALGDFLAAATNKYAGYFFTGPGPVRMENMLVRWVAGLVGYPAGAAGHIASGGSLATLAAIATARDAHGLKAAGYTKAVVYLTEQAHHCIHKALHIAGLGEAQVRHIDVDAGYRMRPDALERAIAADRAAGLDPWLVVAAAGTTDTGAVDPLDDIATIARREACWYHVDAAYGGFFLLTEHGQEILRGIERSDSVVLDPHKGLFLPYGAGMVIVRDGARLAATHGYTGNYMQDAGADQDEMSSADLSPELSRHFRALRMWLPLVTVGVAPFRAALEEKLLLARYFRREIAALGFETGPEPDLSIVTFRWAPRGMGDDEANRINQAIVDAVRRDGRVFLTSTLLDGRFVIRMAALAFRTHRRFVDLAIGILRQKAAEVAASVS